jgi:hypothetical protein
MGRFLQVAWVGLPKREWFANLQYGMISFSSPETVRLVTKNSTTRKCARCKTPSEKGVCVDTRELAKVGVVLIALVRRYIIWGALATQIARGTQQEMHMARREYQLCLLDDIADPIWCRLPGRLSPQPSKLTREQRVNRRDGSASSSKHSRSGYRNGIRHADSSQPTTPPSAGEGVKVHNAWHAHCWLKPSGISQAD